MLLALEQRILEADERLTAAQNALDQAKQQGLATPDMEHTVSLMQDSLSAMTTYRQLILNAARSKMTDAD